MIKAILLDLDNTLITNPDHIFAPAYLGLAEEFFAERWQFLGFSQVLVNTMRAMMGLRDMQRSNINVALDVIENETKRTQVEIWQAMGEFYQAAYPSLKSCIVPVEGGAELIATLKAQDYAVIIATNPVYPAEAIRQRLVWAGLNDDFSYYALVTHSENMHFTKPDPAYYAEILGRVGVEPDEVVMVGDSIRNDMIPAATLGLHSFHIKSEDNPYFGGTLRQFSTLVKDQEWLENLIPLQLTPSMIEPQLRGNLGALFGMLAGVKSHFWMQHPDPNEWSILQIVCHLVESEETVQRPRLKQILTENNPFLSESKPPPGPEAVPCHDEGYHVAHDFLQTRTESINFLRTLTPEDWMRPARHSIFGPTTLLEMAHFTAQHDRLHLKQLCRTLGNCT
ncbi:MAG: HAD-IA family hydrolase [Chitinophagaceae bacterium]|nr:HAD-IA family hydrolase [Anaerolineae bacterium]